MQRQADVRDLVPDTRQSPARRRTRAFCESARQHVGAGWTLAALAFAQSRASAPLHRRDRFRRAAITWPPSTGAIASRGRGSRRTGQADDCFCVPAGGRRTIAKATTRSWGVGVTAAAADDRFRPVAIVPVGMGEAHPPFAPSLVLYARPPGIARLRSRVIAPPGIVPSAKRLATAPVRRHCLGTFKLVSRTSAALLSATDESQGGWAEHFGGSEGDLG
jgi:hypothetical protein